MELAAERGEVGPHVDAASRERLIDIVDAFQQPARIVTGSNAPAYPPCEFLRLDEQQCEEWSNALVDASDRSASGLMSFLAAALHIFLKSIPSRRRNN
jgi:hypothetical protein